MLSLREHRKILIKRIFKRCNDQIVYFYINTNSSSYNYGCVVHSG